MKWLFEEQSNEHWPLQLNMVMTNYFEIAGNSHGGDWWDIIVAVLRDILEVTDETRDTRS